MGKGGIQQTSPKNKENETRNQKSNKKPIEKTKDTQKEQSNSNIILKPTATWQQVQQAYQRTSL